MKIAPETKLAIVLEALPEIQSPLMDWISVTQASPLVWRSLSKAATMGQIAAVIGITFPNLIQRLRDAGFGSISAEQPPSTEAVPDGPPAWATDDNVRVSIDASDLLAHEEHPLGRIRAELKKLEPGEAVRLTTSFYPAPLLHALHRDAVQTYTKPESQNRFATYITRAPQ
jgi:uncharacterized protein (DUF2249 family)